MQSNALKFTKTGGSVSIICKLISCQQDLSCKEHYKYFEKTMGYGMIEISVQDSGIGIRKEDKDKIFNLFGFLDTS